MTALQDIIRRARRRTFLDRALRAAGIGLLAGSIAGLGLLAVDRLASLEMDGWAFALPPLLGLVIGFLFAIREVPDPMAAAVLIDRQMRLKDQFGSAEALLVTTISGGGGGTGPRHDPEFAALVRREADDLAGRIDVRNATPIQITPVWGGSLTLALLLWLGVLFIPSLPSRADSGVAAVTPEQREERRIEREQLAASIDESVEQLQQEAGALDERTQEELEALSKLADQLNATDPGEDDVEQLRDESAARLNEIADRLAEKARRDLAAREEVARKFSGLRTPEPPRPADEFTQALKRGDFEQAADLLDEMTGKAGEMTDEERQVVADHLRELGEQLDETGETDRVQTEERERQLEQALRDQGLDEQAIDSVLNDPPPADELRETLERNNVDPEIARDITRDIEQLEEQREFDEQVREDTERLTDALERAAEQVEEPDQAPEPPPSSESPADQAMPPEDQSGPDAERTPPNETPQDQTPPTEQPETPADQPPATEPPPTGEKDQDQTQQEGDEQRQQEDQTKAQEQPGQQQEQKQQQGREQPGGQPQQQPGTEKQPGAQPQQKPGGQQQEQPQQQGGEEQPQTGEKPGPAPEQQGEKQPGEPPQTPPDAEKQPGAQPTPAAEEQPGAQPQPGTEQQAPQQVPGQDQPQMPGGDQQTESQPQVPPGDEGGEPPITPEQMEQMRKMLEKMPSSTLRELAKRAEEAQKNKEISEDMKRRAREMFEQMSDEQRRKWQELLQQQNPRDADQFPDDQRPPADRPSGGDRLDGMPERNITDDAPREFQFEDTEDVDLRGTADADEVIAEWLSDEPRDGAPGRTTQAGRTKRIENAQQVAERAVSESVVPPRYHEFIKRYFGNLNRTVDRAASGEKPAGETGPSKGDGKSEAKPASGDAGASKDPDQN